MTFGRLTFRWHDTCRDFTPAYRGEADALAKSTTSDRSDKPQKPLPRLHGTGGCRHR
jgi:hypothetical protein